MGRDPVGGIVVGVLLAAGVLTALWPHLVWRPRIGCGYWITDNDDLLYLSTAAQAYHEHPFWIGDPTQREPAAVGTIYPAGLFVPEVLAARLLGLGPFGVSLAWRAWAGASLAVGFYLVARLGARAPVAAGFLALWMLLDAGFMSSRPLVQQFRLAARVLASPPGALFNGKEIGLLQYRILTPGVSLIALAVYVWLTQRAFEGPARRRVLAAGLGFGLLFYTYFYYWTGAGLALLLVVVLDRQRRGVAGLVGGIGVVGGLPALLASAALRRSAAAGWPERFDLFLPVSRTGELLIHKEALVVLGLGLVWVWLRERRWLHLWCLAASGWLLANHAFVTGMQIQNDHWSYVRAPALTFLLVLLVLARPVERLAGSRRGLAALSVFTVVFGGLGLYLRTAEALWTSGPVAQQAVLGDYWRQRVVSGAAPLEPNRVLAGDRAFVDLAVIQEDQRPLDHYAVVLSPYISNAEWDERVALNAVLLGADRATFAAAQRAWLAEAVWGPWGRGRDVRAGAERLASRLAAYDRAAADPETAAARFAVRFLALPRGGALPAGLGPGWVLRQRGPRWDLYERLSLGTAEDAEGRDHARSVRGFNERSLQPRTSARSGFGRRTRLLDGSVRFVKDGVALAVWRALATRSGGELIGGDAY